MATSTRSRLLPLLLVPFVGGCYSWAVQGQHQLKIVAPASVAVGAVYEFRVDVTDLHGQPLRNIHYGWMIDWPQVRGIRHDGLSFVPERMPVKGGAGRALLRLYMLDEKGRISQVDQVEFKVE
jgi:hypothetical protein